VTVPGHNACALLDVDVLTASGFSDRTAQSPGAPESTTHGDVLATYACGNSDSSVIVGIDLHNSPESARQAADYNTSDDQRFLIDSGTRVPFDTTRGGATIINTEPGVSRMNWSNGPYTVLLEVMSDPGVPGLPATHPHEIIDTIVTTIVERADARLTSSSWCARQTPDHCPSALKTCSHGAGVERGGSAVDRPLVGQLGFAQRRWRDQERNRPATLKTIHLESRRWVNEHHGHHP